MYSYVIYHCKKPRAQHGFATTLNWDVPIRKGEVILLHVDVEGSDPGDAVGWTVDKVVHMPDHKGSGDAILLYVSPRGC